MQDRNYKSIIYCVLAGLAGGIVLPLLTGCSEDPDSASAREVRQVTLAALDNSLKDQDFAAARGKVDRAKGRASGQSADTARLASGNLWLAQARQAQTQLDIKSLPLRSAVSAFEKLLRDAESLLLEKERIVALLAAEQKEMEELDVLLAGDGQAAGFNSRYAAAKSDLDKLNQEKKTVEAEMQQVQAVLDEYQSRANALQRKAELAQGDDRLELEKQSFAILKDRKEHYIEVQAAENQVAVLDGKIAQAQLKAEGLAQSIEQAKQRISAIETSPTAAALKQQLQQIDAELSTRQQRMGSIADDLRAGLKNYQEGALEVGGLFENAAAEFEKIRGQDAQFSAALREADSYHGSALARASFIALGLDISERLQDLAGTADDKVISPVEQKLTIRPEADPAQASEALAFFDKAVEAYESASSKAARLTGALPAEEKNQAREVKSAVLKSQVLAVHNKMMLADRLQNFDQVDAASTKIKEIKEKGAELGVSFTQSETMKLIDSGINYAPSLPVNLSVYADDLKRKLSEWKRLPIAQQEAAVQENLKTIDEAVTRYGDELSAQLEPLKQEMLAAQERGFKESAGGPSDPNNF